MTKIVVLDGYTTNPGDISWEPIERLGDVKIYDRTPTDLILERAKNAEILLSNKTIISEEHISLLPQLKCICALATGYNNIDVLAAKKVEVTVCNAVGYSAPAVAQHVFALILELTNRVGNHSKGVSNNEWANASDWCYWNHPLIELKDKTIGIYGLGKIGEQVAEIAIAFGMNVIANRKSDKPPKNHHIKMVDLNTLIKNSDILTLHAPLTEENNELINTHSLSQMKSNAILINTGRGGLVNENDLKDAMVNKTISGAGLDVLSEEPPIKGHILNGVPNCLITPHHAWATKESRERLVEIVATNIKAFLDDKPINVVS